MSKIQSKNTKPELRVRRFIHSLGYRYRLYHQNLAGKPDIVFAGRRKIIFVNGCFWHLHENCKYNRLPKSNLDYWIPKLKNNKLRDKQNIKALEAEGWKCLTIWECETEDLTILKQKVLNFLESN